MGKISVAMGMAMAVVSSVEAEEAFAPRMPRFERVWVTARGALRTEI